MIAEATDLIQQRVRELGQWFHNLNLRGVQTAPEHFLGDYPATKWRAFADAIPADLSGKTVLDIGCNAGYYSIEMKRRGADRVVAIDFDETYLAQARFAAEVLGVDIEFHQLSVYDVAELGERFDVVLFMGVFYHLRHPLLALDLIHRHVAKNLFIFQSMQRGSNEVGHWNRDYKFCQRDIFDDPAFPRMHFIEEEYCGDPTNWWIPNRACSEALLRGAGFQIVAHPEEEVYICRRRSIEDTTHAVYPAETASHVLEAISARKLSRFRCSIVVAHPDDEVIGAGSLLPGLQRSTLVHLTDGAPRNIAVAREQYAAARRGELETALRCASFIPQTNISLNLVDQEAAFHLAQLTRALADHFEAHQAQVVLTHPYEGGHPDHDAAAFAVHAACALMENPPIIAEMAFYHIDSGQIKTGAFLPGSEHLACVLNLSRTERQAKRRLLDCFGSQKEILELFGVEQEQFRIAPRYRFTEPPHEGPLLYETFGWSLTGQRWRECARAALATLDLQEPL